MNNFAMRKSMLVAFLGLAVVLATTAAPSWALTATGSAQSQQARMTSLKARADNEITRRVASLNILITKVNANKRLSSSQKSTLTNGISTEISNLNALKTKIDNDTDVATLKADVQSIVTSYRVYLLYIPQVHVLAADGVIGDVADKLTSLAAQLNTRIQQAKAQGKEVAALEASYNDMLSKVAVARTQATNADTLVVSLTPSGYPGNKTQLVAAQADVVTGKKDLVAAEQDAKSIVKGLKALEKPAGTSGSASSPASR